MVLTFLKTFWPHIIVGLIALFIVGIFVQNKHLKSELVLVRSDLTQAADANNKLLTAIDNNNNKIDEGNKQLQRFNDDLKSLQGKLNNQSSETNRLITSIAGQPKPKTCQEAIQFLKENK